MVANTMDAASWLRKQLEDADPDLLRAMVKEMAEALMSADADAVCGAGYGERSGRLLAAMPGVALNVERQVHWRETRVAAGRRRSM